MRFIYLIVTIFSIVFIQPSCSLLKKGGKTTKQDTVTTASGLQYIILEKGDGPQVKEGANVKVHYTGRLTNDTVFDSSYKRNQPFAFTVGKGRVIKGWDEGIALLAQGDKARFIIPPALGYGARDMGNIPPNSTLIFDIELVEVKNPIVIEPYDVAGKDTITTASGLKYIVVKKGSQKNPLAKPGELVTVHYSGYLKDGLMFDSSVKRGQPIKFTLGQGQVIKGWDEGLQLMRSGDQFRIIIPYQLAYGEAGRGNSIPPKADLTFDVELIYNQPEIIVEAYDVQGKDTITLESGLKMIPVLTNNQQKPTNGQTVDVHYSGYLTDGTMFDSSIKRAEPISFILGQGKVIKGWDEALTHMKIGEKYRVIIPSDLAYGERGAGGVIPPNATLIFDMQLVGIK
ncbi:MAG: FKBP-type peptidyl-prolyl cis-trans isomerase [Bacteroidales bacterium]|nr:FKBP-type peptidyl-prolyl cis-trans isomerase [Bacteroidales bacterium]